MIRIFALISTFFVLLNGGVAFANSSPQTCGFNKQCPDGLACVGATGTVSSGICVLTGPQIALCKTVLYFDSNLVSIFAIFAVVMIGLAFFLGKISWGMIISVILGIAIAKGATSIIKKVSGHEEGYCTSQVIDYSALINKNGDGACVSQITKIPNTGYIYNRSNAGVGPACADPVSCFKHKCTVPSALLSKGSPYVVINETFASYSVSPSNNEFEIFIPSATSLKLTNAKNTTEYASGKDAQNNDIVTASATCTPVTATPNQDYFACLNSCTNSKFGHVYNVGQYADCNAILGIK
jgi:type IV secretory pathway VirB2 component (pilin)